MQSNVNNRKVIITAMVVALVCAAVVTISTILLRPMQDANRLNYMHVNILDVAGLRQEGVAIEIQLQQLETRLIEFDSGRFHMTDSPDAYDWRKATQDPEQSIALSSEQDIAGIKRRGLYAPVYLTRDEKGRIDKIILPIYGYGLWSTLYGFIALHRDTTTVVGLRFYEHGETPGLGGEVDNTRWLSQWHGKQAYDARWQPAIRLKKGGVDHDDPETKHQIDALSGATLTNRGIENILKFWLGKDGFGPFLARVRKSGGRL